MSKLVLIVLAWIFMSCSAHAASFDCLKAQTRVGKLICSDAELSKLDEELAITYTVALKTDEKGTAVRQRQREWLKERDQCVDVDCLKLSYRSRALAMSQSTQGAQGIEALYGKWEAGGTGGIAVYGMMEISKSKITWKGHNPSPRCTVSYELVSESGETKFKENSDHFQTLSPFKSYLLAIHGECALKTTHFRLTLPNNMPNYLDMIEYYNYDSIEDVRGYGHFYKR
jgi:uncharacterized protein